MKQTTLMCPVQVIPLVTPEDAEDQRDRKALVFVEQGETLTYPMEPDLIEEIVKALRMSNKALMLKAQQATEAARARAILNGGAGGPPPGAEELVHDIISGTRDLRRSPN